MARRYVRDSRGRFSSSGGASKRSSNSSLLKQYSKAKGMEKTMIRNMLRARAATAPKATQNLIKSVVGKRR